MTLNKPIALEFQKDLVPLLTNNIYATCSAILEKKIDFNDETIMLIKPLYDWITKIFRK